MDSRWHTPIDLAIILMLVASIWRFRTPKRARPANLIATFALLCAMAVVLYWYPISRPAIVIASLAVGALAGWGIAMWVNMIHIPAMVGFQNGAGGIAAFLVSFVELQRGALHMTGVSKVGGILSLVIGAVAFSGSMVASAKLTDLLKQTPTVLPKHGWILLGTVLGIVVMGITAGTVAGSAFPCSLVALILLSLFLGIVFSVRIGGADMPVSISFLNALTGLAAAFCGIVLQNRLLIACGAIVGASGSVLTYAMCTAMNRNLLEVFLGIPLVSVAGRLKTAGIGAVEPAIRQVPSTASLESEKPREEDTFQLALAVVKSAETVIIVPGYGMALAQAHFEVVHLANRLEEMGKEVRFAVHPVAGRMPGHMNVLLAEAELDYGKLFELDEINPAFKQTDLVLIVGACDVVNPAAIRAEGTPISGMPILMAHEAKHIVVCNLDGQPGYSGVENPLYTDRKTISLFGDAKRTVSLLLRGLD